MLVKMNNGTLENVMFFKDAIELVAGFSHDLADYISNAFREKEEEVEYANQETAEYSASEAQAIEHYDLLLASIQEELEGLRDFIQETERFGKEKRCHLENSLTSLIRQINAER